VKLEQRVAQERCIERGAAEGAIARQAVRSDEQVDERAECRLCRARRIREDVGVAEVDLRRSRDEQQIAIERGQAVERQHPREVRQRGADVVGHGRRRGSSMLGREGRE